MRNEKMPIIKCINDIIPKPTSHGIGQKQVLLSASDTDSVVTQIAKSCLHKEEIIKVHSHRSMDEHFIFIGGLGRIVLDDEVIDCIPNMYIMIPAGCSHSIQAIEDMTFFTLGIAK